MRKYLKILAVVMFVCSFIDMAIQSDVKTDAVYKAPTTTSAIQPEAEVYTVRAETPFESTKERFVAHRGFSDHAPENSVPSFEMAGKAGFWGIETDIVESKDGVFMCMHDETLDRTTNGSGKVSDYTYAELMDFRIDFGTDIKNHPDIKIPTMVEFLNNCVIYDCIPVLEIKKITDYAGFLQTIKDSGLYHRTIIAGDLAALKEIRKLDTQIPVLLLAYATLEYEAYEALLPEIGQNSGLLLNAPLITTEVAQSLHNRGYRIGAWTLDSSEDAQMYIDLGADFVVTNKIPGLKHMINENE